MVLITGGFTSGENSLSSAEMFDPATNTLTHITVLLVAFILASCAPGVISVSPTGSTAPTLTFTSVPPTPSSTGIPPGETLPVIKSGELSIQEFELKEPPDSESRSFKPVIGTESTILSEHQIEREKITEISNFQNYTTAWQGKQITAEQNFQDIGEGNTRTIIVTLDKVEIFRLKIENPVMPSPSLLGLWVFENQWFIETVANSNGQHPYGIGEIFQTGQSLNKLNGYDESFGFQLLAGKPFYFYGQNGKIGIFYNGQSVPVEYDKVPHYGCCSAGGINPIKSENMVSFFARHGRKWYYIEIGIIRP